MEFGDAKPECTLVCAIARAAIQDSSQMNARVRGFVTGKLLLGTLLLTSCLTTAPSGIQQAKIAVSQQIAAETPGDYFVGRRYFEPDYKFWGYIRRPGQPWSTAQMVMLNEKEKPAPDREQMNFGSDNNYEYKLSGYFSGQTVYKPASNGFYPEFVLKNYEIISVSPASIFTVPGATDPERRIIAKPF